MLFYKHLKNIEKDKSFVEIRFGREAENARTELIQLEQKLIDRYKELENNKLQKQIRENDKSKFVAEIGTKTLFNDGKFSVFVFVKNYFFFVCYITVLGITCLELMQVFEKSKNLLIIDARSAEDYQESRIKDFENINISENLIVSG